MNLAAIDIGTNGARLLIGEILTENGRQRIHKIHYSRLPLRLGENVFENGFILPEKIKQFAETIDIFVRITKLFDVQLIRACATSAMREAKNALEITEYISQQTGINVEIISGQQEANLILNTFELLSINPKQNYLCVDVGGGSTEITIFHAGKKKHSQSFEIGTLRMLTNKVEKSDCNAMLTWLHEHTSKNKNYKFYATGGNSNKIQKLIGTKYPDAIKTQKIIQLKNDLDKLSIHERMKTYQLKIDRAEVIIPALDIYCRIVDKLNIKQVLVPKIGLPDGIIYDLYKKHGA